MPDLAQQGIKGWLLIPSAGLIVVMISCAESLFRWLQLLPRVFGSSYFGVYAFEVLLVLGLLVFTLHAGSRFFHKKKDAPRLMIGLMVANVAVFALLFVIELGSGLEDIAVEKSLLGVLIWVVVSGRRDTVLQEAQEGEGDVWGVRGGRRSPETICLLSAAEGY